MRFIGSNAAVTSAATYTGYWRLDNNDVTSNLWPNFASPYFRGQLDDVRIYNRRLTNTDVANLYTSTPGPYACDASCTSYWTLDESSGTSASDSSGNANTGTLQNFSLTAHIGSAGNTGTLNGFLFNSTDGWSSGVFSNGLKFAGGETVFTGTALIGANLDTFTISAWFSTTGTGGRIAGLCDTSTCTSNDHHLYLDGSGHVAFGVWPGVARTVTSAKTYNDGDWHFAVGTLSPVGLILYLDGVQVAKDPTTTTGWAYGPQNGLAYVKMGGSMTNTWVASPSPYNGSLDDVRVYRRALTDYEVYDQYLSGRSGI